MLLVVFTVLFFSMSTFELYNISNRQYEAASKAAGSIEYMTVLSINEMSDPLVSKIYNSALGSWSSIVGSDITVIDANANVYASTNNIKRVPKKLSEQVLADKPYRGYNKFGSYYDSFVLTIALPVKYNNEVIGAIFFNTTLGMIQHSLLDFFEIFCLSSLISVVIAIVLIYFQAKKISKPITGINSAVLDIASGKFDKRLPVTSRDETGQLASSFNYMAESLGELEDMRQNFISDVSHELRTPMTSISGFVAGILDGTIPPEKHSDYLKIVLDESRRLSRMASEMLEMSKMSSSEYKLDMKKFDLCETVRLGIISLESKIDAKNLELEVEFAHEHINVLADKDSILRVVINLLDNAVKFSYDNTKVTISVWCDVQNAYVRVGNFGIGIEQRDLEHVFDRFYKTDKSRGKDKSGAGLGLSMAKNIISLHNGSIWAESTKAKEGSDVKYTTFTFKLQMA